MKAIKIIIAGLVLIFIGVQFIPTGIPENKSDEGKSIVNDSLINSPVLEQFRKSCFDCHSNQVNLPWYSKVAPSSWLLAGHINEGRSYLNFSEWGAYSTREKIGLLEDIRDEVSAGKMPLKSYLLVHGEARLDSAQKSSILKWVDDTSSRILE